MENTLVKIQKAIELIKSKNLKKLGKNTFSKYDYYTPEQVAELVTWACREVKILPKFDLKRNELGITGTLSIYNLEAFAEMPVIYEMASAIPDIKATNISQQIGGAMTYTKRYLLMNAFDIVDNNLDFDTTENTKTNVTKGTSGDSTSLTAIKNAIKSCNSIADITKIWANNKELQGEQFFIDLLSDRKKILKQNGIEN
jgi:hypothetical protein